MNFAGAFCKQLPKGIVAPARLTRIHEATVREVRDCELYVLTLSHTKPKTLLSSCSVRLLSFRYRAPARHIPKRSDGFNNSGEPLFSLPEAPVAPPLSRPDRADRAKLVAGGTAFRVEIAPRAFNELDEIACSIKPTRLR